MKIFDCVCYPTVEKYKTRVEAKNADEARIIAEEEAIQNIGYVVDVEEV